MYKEASLDYVFDQGMYYPTATNYGYYCTGLESPCEWENHHVIFGVDGSDVQFAGARVENSPYLCITPSYGYAESPYNPYNPYIPDATIGMDGSFAGSQQYCTYPLFQNTASSPAYIPVVVQPDVSTNSSSNSMLGGGASVGGGPAARVSKNKFGSESSVFPGNPSKIATYQKNPLSRNTEGPRANIGQSKQHANAVPTSTRIFQGKTTSVSVSPTGSVSTGRHLSPGQYEVPLSVSGGFSDFGSNYYTANHRLRPKLVVGRSVSNANGRSTDALCEQNRGPRTKRSKSQLVVKAYTTKAGDTDAEGNIVINTDQYNKDDFQIDYAVAKFFVIKSYSEDDVHKSIKYNVWSSTPHGNKKLQNAYEDAQKVSEKSSGCPIFLFFSVNASGLFCGVAEMIGPVDFNKDMDFWQQDKWNGSFPVKWHIIKDVPNSYFRHITLQNNENKAVTNSRDTQEIMPKQGLEMLKIFKEHTTKTSLLDDFMYYENRQRIVREEKAQLPLKSFQRTFPAPELDSARNLNFMARTSLSKDETASKPGNLDHTKTHMVPSEDKIHVSSDVKGTINSSQNLTHTSFEAKEDLASTLRLDSLTIDPKKAEAKPVATSLSDVVTVGSMPIKVDGYSESSPMSLTVGTIPLDPQSLLK